MTTVWQNIPSILNSVIHTNKIIIMSKWHLVLSLAIKKKNRWTRGFALEIPVHGQTWALVTLWYPRSGLGWWRPWTGDTDCKTKPFPSKLTIFRYSTPPKKHQTTTSIPQPSQCDWVWLFASLTSRYAQQTNKQKKTLCISIMLKFWPQSTKWITLFTFSPIIRRLIGLRAERSARLPPGCC